MGLGLIIEVVLVILIVMTAMTEPALSFKYAKALAMSGVKFIKVVVQIIKGFQKPKETTEKSVEVG